MIYTAKNFLHALESGSYDLYEIWTYNFTLDKSRYIPPCKCMIGYPLGATAAITPYNPSARHHELFWDRTQMLYASDPPVGQEFASSEKEARDRFDVLIQIMQRHYMFKAALLNEYRWNCFDHFTSVISAIYPPAPRPWRVLNSEQFQTEIASGQITSNMTNCHILTELSNDECMGLVPHFIKDPVSINGQSIEIEIDNHYDQHLRLGASAIDLSRLVHGYDSNKPVIVQLL